LHHVRRPWRLALRLRGSQPNKASNIGDMRIDVAALVNALRDFTAAGKDVAALDLHLEALLFARAGDLLRAGASFGAAQEIESARETTATLTKMRNRKGVALCLRSIGEIALIKPHSTELERAWEMSERLFVATGSPEASQLAVWRTRIREALASA